MTRLSGEQKIGLVEASYLKKEAPAFDVGDTVRVYVKVPEEGKVRLQAFEGMVIRKCGKKGISSTFTVRRVSYGEGIERIFPLHSPNVDRVVRLKSGKVRRARLYYLARKKGKASRVEQKREEAAEAETAPTTAAGAGTAPA